VSSFSIIGGNTFKLLTNLVTKNGKNSVKYVEYVNTHKMLQVPKLIKITEKFTLYKQNQQLSKIVITYLAELRRLASTYEFKQNPELSSL